MTEDGTMEYEKDSLLDYTKSIEQQLITAREEITKLRKFVPMAIALSRLMQEISHDIPDLRGHECVAKHKLLSMFALWRKKIKPHTPAFFEDKITSQDGLIRQLRAALKKAAPSVKVLFGCYSEDYTEIQKALIASEKGCE